MSSTKDGNENTSRRAFFQDVTAGAAGLAVATALVQLGAPAHPSRLLRHFSKILRHGLRGPLATSTTIFSVPGFEKTP
jgi:hypothetical protein